MNNNEQTERILSGNCGENATYTFDVQTGVLNISGSGNLDSIEFDNSTSQHNHYEQIKIAIIDFGITSFGTSTFNGLCNLREISIPDSITTIEVSTFDECNKLSCIEIGNNSKFIKDLKKFGCSNMVSLIINDNVTEIEEGAFSECNNILSVTIGNNVTTIKESAFYGCSNLMSVIISDSLTTICPQAFNHCENLSSVIMGNNVKTIDNGAFDKCGKLNQINLPNSVTTIGAYAFAECNLTSIVIPKNVIEIGRQAFNRCYNLSSAIFLGTTAPSSGLYVFNKCSKLKNVTVLEGYTDSSFCDKDIQVSFENGANCTIA